jgi:hypothetical protein
LKNKGRAGIENEDLEDGFNTDEEEQTEED